MAAKEQITAAQFEARMKAREAAMRTASKEKPAGIMDNEAIIAAMNLEESSRTVPCSLSAIKFGVDKNNVDYIRVSFVCLDPEFKGMTFGPIISFKKAKVGAKLTPEMRAMFLFQSLGYDTAAWEKTPVKSMMAAIKEVNTDKPNCKVQLSVWGDNADQIDYRIIALTNGDPAVGDELEESTDDLDWVALGILCDTDSGPDGDAALEAIKTKAEELGVDPDDYDTWQSLGEYIVSLDDATSLEETEEEESEEVEEPGPSWVGEEVTWTEYDCPVKITDCNVKKKIFTVYHEEEDTTYEVSFTDVTR